MELGKLSVFYNLDSLSDNIASTLLGVGRMDILNINLDIVFNGLNDKEKEVLEYIKENFFKDIGNATWETGIWDLDVYNKAVADK